MSVHIPGFGDIVELTSDWLAEIPLARENKSICRIDKPNQNKVWNNWNCTDFSKTYTRTFPAGTTFSIQKIQIARKKGCVDTITLLLKKSNIQKINDFVKTQKGYAKKVFFTVELKNFNSGSFQVVEKLESAPIDWKPITVQRLLKLPYKAKTRVTFKHPDPKLSFVSEHKVYSIDEEHTYAKSTEGIKHHNHAEIVSILPDSALYAWRLIPKFATSCLTPIRNGSLWPNFDSWSLSKHPLKRELGIPFSKIEREKIGLPYNKAQILNVKVCGGLLTIEEWC